MTSAARKSKRSRPDGDGDAAGLDHALLRATYEADLDGVIAALEDGADIEAVDSRTGLSALHIAIGTNNEALTRLLVEDWGALFKPDRQGRWPSVIAARCRVDEDLCDYIVESEVKVMAEE